MRCGVFPSNIAFGALGEYDRIMIPDIGSCRWAGRYCVEHKQRVCENPRNFLSWRHCGTGQLLESGVFSCQACVERPDRSDLYICPECVEQSGRTDLYSCEACVEKSSRSDHCGCESGVERPEHHNPDYNAILAPADPVITFILGCSFDPGARNIYGLPKSAVKNIVRYLISHQDHCTLFRWEPVKLDQHAAPAAAEPPALIDVFGVAGPGCEIPGPMGRLTRNSVDDAPAKLCLISRTSRLAHFLENWPKGRNLHQYLEALHSGDRARAAEILARPDEPYLLYTSKPDMHFNHIEVGEPEPYNFVVMSEFLHAHLHYRELDLGHGTWGFCFWQKDDRTLWVQGEFFFFRNVLLQYVPGYENKGELLQLRE